MPCKAKSPKTTSRCSATARSSCRPAKKRGLELAYNAVAGKYDRGMVSALDLQTAANNLLQARSERLRARLQYIIKTRLVEYYNGAP